MLFLQREQTPVPFHMPPSKHAEQRSPLVNQQLGLESPLLRPPKNTAPIPPQGQPLPWHSIADPRPSGPGTSLFGLDTPGPSLPPTQQPGFMSFQNLRTGASHAGKRSEKAARVHALLDEVLEDDKPRELFEPGENAGAQGGGEKGFELGFTNGLGKKVEFSKTSWAKAQNLLQEELPSMGTSGFTGGCANMQPAGTAAGLENGQAQAGTDFGFTNGLGAKIGFSDAAWGKAQNLMREERVPSGGGVNGRPGGPVAPAGFENGPQEAGLNCGSMTGIGRSEFGAPEWRGLAEEQGALQGHGKNVGPELAEKPAFEFGFTTGSGRKVGISDTARKRAHSLLQEELGPSGLQGFQQGLAQGGREDVAIGFASAVNQGFAQSSRSGEAAGLTSGFTRGVGQAIGGAGAMDLASAGPAEKGLDFGFTSGSGKKVGFSSAADAKAQALLRNEMGQSDLGVFPAAAGTVGGLANGQSPLLNGVNFADQLQNEAHGQGAAANGLAGFQFDVPPADPKEEGGFGGWRADEQASGALIPIGQQLGIAKTPEPQADGFSISFQTGSLKPLAVTPAELQRGRAFFGADAADFGSGNPGPDDVSMTSPSFHTGARGGASASQGGASAAAFGGGGFRTGGMKPLHGRDAKRLAWARRLLDDDNAPLTTGADVSRTHPGDRLPGEAGGGVPGEPLRLGWQPGGRAPDFDTAERQEGAHSFGFKRQRLETEEARQPGEPLRLGWQGPGDRSEDDLRPGVTPTEFQTNEQTRGAVNPNESRLGAQSEAQLRKEKLDRALSCWALDDGGAARAASDPKPLNPGVQHLRSGSANAQGQQRLHQSGPAGVQGLGPRSRQPLATIGLGNRSVVTPGNQSIGDKPRKLK